MSGLHKSLDETQLSQSSMVDTDPRIQPVLRIERTLLLIRYIALFVFMLLFGFELVPPSTWVLVVIASATLYVNAFAHIIIFTGSFAYFVHPINLITHLVYISILVCISGAEFSPLIVYHRLWFVCASIQTCLLHSNVVLRNACFYCCCLSYAFQCRRILSSHLNGVHGDFYVRLVNGIAESTFVATGDCCARPGTRIECIGSYVAYYFKQC